MGVLNYCFSEYFTTIISNLILDHILLISIPKFIKRVPDRIHIYYLMTENTNSVLVYFLTL